MKINKNHLLFFLLSIYFLVGCYLSITTGISHDEYHEQLNWEVNLFGIKSFLSNSNYETLLNYKDRYHGIGFHLISQPIQILLSKFVSNINDLSFYGGHLVSKHAVIFLLFTISGIFFYLICLKISKNFYFSLISTLIYLFYPYFYGHAQINPKDIPFLSFWLINSYIFLTILESFFNEGKIKLNKIILFSLTTAFLLSIRITGIIIFLEYLIGLIILINIKNINLYFFFKKNYLTCLYFLISCLLFLYILNPIFWKNPYEIINSIKYMSKYQQDICTLTLGNCLQSLNLPSSYYFIWLFFKLPIIVFLGILLFPFIEKKIFKNNINLEFIYYSTFLLTPIIIIIIFIILNISLYDEIRHIMFLIPMIFVISLMNIFIFNKKLFFTLCIPVVFFFILENISLNPYQYTWLNSFAKTKDIKKNFEIDYWGISNKSLQKEIVKYSEKNSLDKNICVYGDLYVKEFLLNEKFTCFKNYTEVDSIEQRPFFAYKNVRNVKRSNPKDCELIFNETYNYTFSKKDISVGTLWFCS